MTPPLQAAQNERVNDLVSVYLSARLEERDALRRLGEAQYAVFEREAGVLVILRRDQVEDLLALVLLPFPQRFARFGDVRLVRRR